MCDAVRAGIDGRAATAAAAGNRDVVDEERGRNR